MADVFTLNVLVAAAGVAVAHTLFGPDHYIPFLALARARNWGLAKTLTVAGACGVAHVLSSILLGALGLAFGAAIGRIEGLETYRGDIAAWLLVAFGGAYALWGVRHAWRRRGGYELHGHDGDVHVHRHGGHSHSHAPAATAGHQSTFWALFIVFVLGPCEPLIPLFVLPASRDNWGLAAATAIVFGVVTVACMLAVVALGHAGLSRLNFGPLERWSHAMAGSVVAASGLAVIFLGL